MLFFCISKTEHVDADPQQRLKEMHQGCIHLRKPWPIGQVLTPEQSDFIVVLKQLQNCQDIIVHGLSVRAVKLVK